MINDFPYRSEPANPLTAPHPLAQDDINPE
jgi:hypothetical protein